MTIDFHHLEDMDSRRRFMEVNGISTNDVRDEHHDRRRLRHHHHRHHVGHESSEDKFGKLEIAQENDFWAKQKKMEHDSEAKVAKQHRKRQKLMHELYQDSGIHLDSIHGLMIDAGSTGSRLHVYEWKPRVLSDPDDIAAAVAGDYISVPGTESRWTDRLRPGLDTFASIQDDDELRQAVRDYLQPLLEFAETVLHEKRNKFGEYPIFLRATAGMRILSTEDRARVMEAVRSSFRDKTYSPFAFVDEQARVLSGEEEAIYDWTGVNFLLGNLVEQSAGAGSVVEPTLTHGALDLGGGSTQIAFFEPNGDIMSNLFKLQIGQAKHWNLYAHSFLFYGINEAIARFHSRLIANKTVEERLVKGIHNPCLPGGSEQQVRTDIHVKHDGLEIWESDDASVGAISHAILKNEKANGDVDQCFEEAKALLHLEKNDWCDFAHKGDCSFAGIYQPALPVQSPNFGEFLAFSNYYHVWQFLHLPAKASIAQLEQATRHACSLSKEELIVFNDGIVSEDELDSYCFRSAYVYQLLRNGYGFRDEDSIRATRVVAGHQVGWCAGAMLYEINAMPWKYVEQKVDMASATSATPEISAIILIGIVSMLSLLFAVFRLSRQRRQFLSEYECLLEKKESKSKYDSL
ncbi:ectonucleoside triphosphate diphosphohydrolase 4 [Fistulifera solaris]|jgi:Golgi nucleoside diphosphatase|uniref:Ectonucleoside triphosphate diphosphohydrolase 4 n=1 Tax=Fistulifera solaris TaxID=1519565 RepID=A0A1Z5JSN3_FISSO|nr:ectonucleoside triphosphate diphosphohydrolase 4 [Fistulifera solaris]|eukprot:GAX16949.1 ectonucleoside triphosphate diphosphohydrolase 4 [Fistulifera solaris]